MSFETYDVYFSGKLIKGRDPQEVQRKIGVLFKLQGAKLQRLFSGQPIAIKKGVDMDQAARFRVAFRDAGALVDIHPSGATQPAAQPTPPSAAPGPAGEQMSLSPAKGFDLSDCAPAISPQPLPDISALALEKPGSILDDTPPPAPLEIDIDAWELASPGATLGPSAPEPEAEIDTGDLRLGPANQGSLEEFQPAVEPAALPNIDHLDLLEAEQKPTGKAVFKISEDEAK